MKNVEIFNGNWTVEDVINNPNKIFVFGDNNARSGKGGQAIIRGLLNTAGIRTKKAPNNRSTSFYKDTDLEENKKNILEDVTNIKNHMLFGYTIVLSSGGYGTGLANLKEFAPKTFEYLCQVLKDNFHFDNETGKKWVRIPSHQEMINAKELPMNYKHGKLAYGQESPGYFRKELLDAGITSTFYAIKKGFRTATTRTSMFKAGDLVKFTNDSTDEFLICKAITDSYPVSSISKETWSKLEGWDVSYFKLNPGVEDKYQFQFEYICSVDNGVIKFRDGIFG